MGAFSSVRVGPFVSCLPSVSSPDEGLVNDRRPSCLLEIISRGAQETRILQLLSPYGANITSDAGPRQGHRPERVAKVRGPSLDAVAATFISVDFICGCQLLISFQSDAVVPVVRVERLSTAVLITCSAPKRRLCVPDYIPGRPAK